jgi:F-type H+-transporting ATPase subunit delta
VRGSAAARRYARALFALARESDSIPTIRKELDGLAELFEHSPDLARSLFRPLHPVAQRRKLLASVCERAGTRPTVRNFCAFLIDQRRLIAFEAIREEFGRLADDAGGRTRAQVVSAAPLAPAGREIELSESVDPSLLGGAIATVDGLVFDGSLRTQLSQMRASLMRGQ